MNDMEKALRLYDSNFRQLDNALKLAGGATMLIITPPVVELLVSLASNCIALKVTYVGAGVAEKVKKERKVKEKSLKATTPASFED